MGRLTETKRCCWVYSSSASASASASLALSQSPTYFARAVVAQDLLLSITGSDQINPVCCQSVSTLIADKCACEEKPMSFVTKRLDKTGVQLSSFIGLAKTVMGNMGCDAAEQLQVYPDCVS